MLIDWFDVQLLAKMSSLAPPPQQEPEAKKVDGEKKDAPVIVAGYFARWADFIPKNFYLYFCNSHFRAVDPL